MFRYRFNKLYERINRIGQKGTELNSRIYYC